MPYYSKYTERYLIIFNYLKLFYTVYQRKTIIALPYAKTLPSF
jgi:hypothetical protein